MKQQQIPFEELSRLALLERVFLLGNGVVRASTLRAVLLKVYDYSKRKGICWASQQRIAAETDYSRRSVLRALKELRKQQLLLEMPAPPPAKTKGYCINWGEISRLAATSAARSPETAARDRGQEARTIPQKICDITCDSESITCDSESITCDSESPKLKELKEQERRLASTTFFCSEEGNTHAEIVAEQTAGWKCLGPSQRADLVRAAAAKPVPVGELRQILEEFSRSAPGLVSGDPRRARDDRFRSTGAIFFRIDRGFWPAAVREAEQAKRDPVAASPQEPSPQAIRSFRQRVQERLAAGQSRQEIETAAKAKGFGELLKFIAWENVT